MTQSGEVMTLKGESMGTRWGLKREASIHYSNCLLTFNTITSSFLKAESDCSLQMIFLLKGSLSGFLPGAKKACLTFTEQQHNIIFINEKLRLQVKTETHDIIFIRIDQAFLSAYFPTDHVGYLNIKSGIENAEPAVFSGCNLYMTSEINAILNTLRTSTHTGFCERLFLESKILELLVFQLSQFEQLKDHSPARQLKKESQEKMYEVKRFLMNNMHQPFSLRSLAHMVGTNEFNLKRDFKLAFGTTVFGYLNDHKMTWAKRMLIERDITIAEVSEKTGYKYATHFSSAFKKYFGYLPNRLKSGKLSLLLFIEDFSVLFEELVTLIP